jgi:hypothetical protein
MSAKMKRRAFITDAALRNTSKGQRTTMERWLPVVRDTKVRGIE